VHRRRDSRRETSYLDPRKWRHRHSSSLPEVFFRCDVRPSRPAVNRTNPKASFGLAGPRHAIFSLCPHRICLNHPCTSMSLSCRTKIPIVKQNTVTPHLLTVQLRYYHRCLGFKGLASGRNGPGVLTKSTPAAGGGLSIPMRTLAEVFLLSEGLEIT